MIKKTKIKRSNLPSSSIVHVGTVLFITVKVLQGMWKFMLRNILFLNQWILFSVRGESCVNRMKPHKHPFHFFFFL